MSETKLLPCPFCGDAPKHSEHVGGSASVWCAECGIAIDGDGQADAAARWNRRADLGETVARAWAVANAAAREAAELRRAPTDAERADMRDVIAAHERANERMRQEARELTERLALVTKQRDEAEARAQTVAAQVAASTHGHSETPSGALVSPGGAYEYGVPAGADDIKRHLGVLFDEVRETLREIEAVSIGLRGLAEEAGTMVATSPSGEVMAVVQRQVDALPEDRDEPRMRLPGEMWWRIHRSTSRVELLFAEPPNEPRCMGAIVPGPKDRWVWRGSPASIDEGAMRDVMRSVEEACGRGPLDEEVVP